MFCAFSLRAVTIDSLSRAAMTNACMSRSYTMHHIVTSSLSPAIKIIPQESRSFSAACPLAISDSTLPLTDQLSAASTTQRSDEWFALRKDKLTTSTFHTALGFWKGTKRAELWSEKVFTSVTKSVKASNIHAMEWGVLNETAAIKKYKLITGLDVSYLGFAIHSDQKSNFLGASPDGLLKCSDPDPGILEVKCPFNKGKPALALPWSTMPFYYMPQIQGQMEIMGRDWVDLYCWTLNGSTIFRVNREREYWDLIHKMLHEYWWENVIPAKEALLVGGAKAANFYKPASKHKLTGLVISKSIKLAAEAKLLCKEIDNHVEFYT